MMAAVQNTELFIPNDASIRTLPLHSLPRSITKKILAHHPNPTGPAALICPVELRVTGVPPNPPPLHPGHFLFPIVTSKLEAQQLLQSFLNSGGISLQFSPLNAGAGSDLSNRRNLIVLCDGRIYLTIRKIKQPSAPPTHSPVPQVGGGISDVIEGRRMEGRAEDHGKCAEETEDDPQTPMKDASTNTIGLKIKAELFAETELESEWRDASTGGDQRYTNTDIERFRHSAVRREKGHVNRMSLQGSAREGNIMIAEAEERFSAQNKGCQRRISGNVTGELNEDPETEILSSSVKSKGCKNDVQIGNVEVYESGEKALSHKLNSNIANTKSCFIGKGEKTSVSSKVSRSSAKNETQIIDVDKSPVGTLSSEILDVDNDDRVSNKITNDSNRVATNVENSGVHDPSVEGGRCEDAEIVDLTDDQDFANIATEKENWDVTEVKSCDKRLASEVEKLLMKRDSTRDETNSDVAESESCFKPDASEIQKSSVNVKRFRSDAEFVNNDNTQAESHVKSSSAKIKGHKSNTEMFHVINDEEDNKNQTALIVESYVEAEKSKVQSSSEVEHREDVKIIDVSDDQDSSATEETNSDVADSRSCDKPHASEIQKSLVNFTSFRSNAEIINNDNDEAETHDQSAKIKNCNIEIFDGINDDQVSHKSTYDKNQTVLNVESYVEAENNEVRSSSEVECCEDVKIVKVYDQQKSNLDATEVKSCVKPHASETQRSVVNAKRFRSDTANLNNDNNLLKGHKSAGEIFHISNNEQVSHKSTCIKKQSVVNVESYVEVEHTEDVEIVEVSDDHDNIATEKMNLDVADSETFEIQRLSANVKRCRSDTEIVIKDNNQDESHSKSATSFDDINSEQVSHKSTYVKNQTALNVESCVEVESSEVRSCSEVERSEAVEIIEVSDGQRKTNSEEVESCVKARMSESQSLLAGSDFLNKVGKCQIALSKMKCRKGLSFDGVTDKPSKIKSKNVTRKDSVNSENSKSDVSTFGTSLAKSNVIEIDDNDDNGDVETHGNADKTIQSVKSCLSDANTRPLAAKANRVSFKSSVDVMVIDGDDLILRKSPKDASGALPNDENGLAEAEIVNVNEHQVGNQNIQITEAANSPFKTKCNKRKICDSSPDGACPDVVDVKSYVESASAKRLKHDNDTNSDGTNQQNCVKSHVNVVPSSQVDNGDIDLNSYTDKSSLATNTNVQNTKHFGDQITGADQTNSYVTDVKRPARSQICEVECSSVNFESCLRVTCDVNVVTDGNEGRVSSTVKTTQIINHDEQEAISDFVKSKNIRSFSTSVENTETANQSPSGQEVGVSSSFKPSIVNHGFDYAMLSREEKIARLREKIRGLENTLNK